MAPMELLKKAMLGTATEDSISDSDKPFKLNLQLTNTYTLKELYFYLKNHQRTYPQYVELCSSANILPILIEDCSTLIDFFQSYTIPSIHIETLINNTNMDFTYILNLIVDKNKGITTEKTIKYIIVPENVQSHINILNIKDFIENKIVKSVNVEELFVADDMIGIVYKNKTRFTVVNTIEQFTTEDWCNVAGIFLDGTPWQLKQLASQGLVEIFEQVPCFYVYMKGQYITKLKGYNINELLVDDVTHNLLTDVDFDSILLKNK